MVPVYLKRFLKGAACLALGLMMVACGGGNGDSAGGKGASRDEGPKTPSIPEVQAATPVVMPAVSTLADPTILGSARLREPNKLIDRIAVWTTLFQPTMDATALRAQIQGGGIDVAEMRAGANAALFFWDPQGDLSSGPPGAIVLPVPPTGTTATGLSTNMGAQVANVDDNVIVAQRADILDKAQAAGAELLKVAQARMDSDAQIHLALAPIMTNYGAQLRSQVGMFQSMMSMAAGQAGGSQQMIANQINALMNGLDQSESFDLGLDFDPNHIELTGLVKAKAETELAKALNDGAIAAPNFAQFIPVNNLAHGQVVITNPQAFIKLNMGLFKSDPSAEKALVKLQPLMDEFVTHGRMVYAFGIDLSADKGMQYQGIFQSEKPDGLRDLFHRMIQVINDPDVAAMYTSMGIKLTTAIKPDVRKVQGWPVDQYTFTIEPIVQPTANEQAKMQAEIFAKLFKNPTVEFAQMGPLVLFSWGQPIDALAETLISGKAGQTPQAMKDFAPGGWLYADFDMVNYIKVLPSLLPAEMAGKMPQISGEAPPIVVFGAHDQGQAYYRLRVPKAMVNTFINASKTAQPAPTADGIAPAEQPDSVPPATLNDAVPSVDPAQPTQPAQP